MSGKQLTHIEKLQKAAVRIITFSNYNSHSKPLFKEMNIDTIQKTVLSLNMKLVHDTITHESSIAIQKTLDFKYVQLNYHTREAFPRNS